MFVINLKKKVDGNALAKELKASIPPDEFYDNSLFKLNKKFLSTIGRWPYQDRKTRITIASTICIAILTVVIPEVIYFVEVFKDINKMIDCLPALILTYVAYVMMFNSVVHFHAMTEIFDEFRKNWSDLKDEKEFEIFLQYAEEGRIFVVVYAGCVVSSLTTFSLVPLLPKILDIILPLNETRPITNLLEVEYFIDQDKYYWPIYFHGLQAAIGVVIIIITIDGYFILISQHVCSMFAVLGYRIDSIGKNNTKNVYKYFKYDMGNFVSDKVNECIKYHSHCIRFAELIEDSFTISWLMQIFVNIIIISITGVQTITRKNNPAQMLKFGLNLTSIIFRLFYISWPGQKIADHSSQVHEFVCNVTWYDFPEKSKKLLIMMLLRSSRPCYITAGKMIPLNFETYCKLMQTSMSYLTVILSTQ